MLVISRATTRHHIKQHGKSTGFAPRSLYLRGCYRASVYCASRPIAATPSASARCCFKFTLRLGWPRMADAERGPTPAELKAIGIVCFFQQRRRFRASQQVNAGANGHTDTQETTCGDATSDNPRQRQRAGTQEEKERGNLKSDKPQHIPRTEGYSSDVVQTLVPMLCRLALRHTKGKPRICPDIEKRRRPVIHNFPELPQAKMRWEEQTAGRAAHQLSSRWEWLCKSWSQKSSC